MMWDAIRYVSTPLTLLAFLAAVAAILYRHRCQRKIRELEALPPKDRAEMALAKLETYSIKHDNLTREQKFGLMMEVLRHRRERYRIAAIVALLFAAIAATAASIGFLKSQNGPSRIPEPVRVTTKIDPEKCVYRQKAYDPKRPILPSSFIMIDQLRNKVEWVPEHKWFNTVEEFEAYYEKRQAEDNPWMYHSLSEYGLTPLEVPLLFEPPQVPIPAGAVMKGLCDPVLYVTITNPNTDSITVNRVEATVHAVIEILGGATTRRLEPVHEYLIPISSHPGIYQPDPNLLLPDLVVAAGDSISTLVRFRPISAAHPTGKYLVCSLTFFWHGGQSSTPKFMMYWEDDTPPKNKEADQTKTGEK